MCPSCETKIGLGCVADHCGEVSDNLGMQALPRVECLSQPFVWLTRQLLCLLLLRINELKTTIIITFYQFISRIAMIESSSREKRKRFVTNLTYVKWEFNTNMWYARHRRVVSAAQVLSNRWIVKVRGCLSFSEVANH